MKVNRTRTGQYFSAIKGTSENLEIEPIVEYKGRRVHAFAHNVLNGWDDRFGGADVIYTEPAWRDGFKKFMALAGQTGTHTEYLKNTREIIQRLGKPAYVFCGKHMFKVLDADEYRPIILREYGYHEYVAVFNEDRHIEATTTSELISKLCENYGTLLDFNCGCGNVLNSCKNEDTRFILSDVNPDCIGYIKKRETNEI